MTSSTAITNLASLDEYTLLVQFTPDVITSNNDIVHFNNGIMNFYTLNCNGTLHVRTPETDIQSINTGCSTEAGQTYNFALYQSNGKVYAGLGQSSITLTELNGPSPSSLTEMRIGANASANPIQFRFSGIISRVGVFKGNITNYNGTFNGWINGKHQPNTGNNTFIFNNGGSVHPVEVEVSGTPEVVNNGLKMNGIDQFLSLKAFLPLLQ